MAYIPNTLYITSPNAWLRLQGETVIVKVAETKKQIPLHHIGAIVGFGDMTLTAQLMKFCAEKGCSVVHLDRYGRFICRMEGTVHGNILLRKAQFQKEQEVEFRQETARAIVAGKLQNSRNLLLRSARDCSNESEQETLRHTATTLAGLIQSAKRSPNLEHLRGIEGRAAKEYFTAFSAMLRQQKEVFQMTARSKRPPRDPLNALLSFLYTLVTHECRSALESVGLDPQLGFFHEPRPGRASLAVDLVEEFRPTIADRLALSLINRKQLASKHFEERPGGAVYLNEAGRKIVLEAYQKKKQETLTHPVFNQKATFGLLPHLQARLLARHVRGELAGYLPFVLK